MEVYYMQSVHRTQECSQTLCCRYAHSAYILSGRCMYIDRWKFTLDNALQWRPIAQVHIVGASLSYLTQKILNPSWCAVYTELGEHAWMSSVIIKLILLQKYWVWGRGCPPPATLFCDKKLCSSNTVLHQLASNWLSKLIITKVVMIHHKSRWSHVQLQLLNLSVSEGVEDGCKSTCVEFGGWKPNGTGDMISLIHV